MRRGIFIVGIVVLLSSVPGRVIKTQQPSSLLTNSQSGERVVQLIDEKGLQKLIRNRNKKILLLNIWATWCAPCVEEFPDLVKLSKHYSAHEVEVVAISADFPDEVDSKILPFLKKQNVPFKTYVGSFKNQDSFINSLNKSWNGALPATFIYDAKGKQRFFTIGKSKFDSFKNEIEKVKGTT